MARKDRVLECRYVDNDSDRAAGKGVRCKHGAGIARVAMRENVEGMGLAGPHMEEDGGGRGGAEGEIFPGLKS